MWDEMRLYEIVSWVEGSEDVKNDRDEERDVIGFRRAEGREVSSRCSSCSQKLLTHAEVQVNIFHHMQQ